MSDVGTEKENKNGFPTISLDEKGAKKDGCEWGPRRWRQRRIRMIPETVPPLSVADILL